MSPAAQPSEAPPPVLILAARESGGSLLSELLGAHPQFCAAPHLNVLAFPQLWQLRRYAVVPRDSHMHGLLRFVADSLTGEQTAQSIRAAQRWLSRWETVGSGVLHAQLRALAAPRRLVDFSPLAALSPEAMARAVERAPGAHVIHLLRHPVRQGLALSRPVWQSTMSSLDYWRDRGTYQPWMDLFEIGEQYIDWSARVPEFDPQFAWHRIHRTAARLRERSGIGERWITLREEDLRRDPEREIAALLDRLGADADARTVGAMRAAGPSRFSAIGPVDAPFGIDFEMFETDVGAVLERAPAEVPDDPETALPWRTDGEALLGPVIELAREFRYFEAGGR